MELTDIMFGDYFYDENHNIIKIDGNFTVNQLNTIEPIQLTRDFLNSNFDKTKYLNVFETFVLGHIQEVTMLGYNIENREDNFAITRENGTWIMNIKYVHQLQHFLNLVGIDKELKI